MSALPVIFTNMKVDIGIKNRAKMNRINKRHQFENPGDKFEFPKKCKINHPIKNKNMKCNLITSQDVLSFRAEIFKTIEKKDQSEFISQYLTVLPTKRHRNCQFKVAKMVTTQYHIKRKSGDVVQVCKEMFHAATGISDRKTRTIIKKLFRKELLMQGDSDFLQTKVAANPGHEERIKKMLIARKEKLLSLEKGTYEQFVKAMAGQKDDSSQEASESEEIVEEETPKKKRRKYYKPKKVRLAESMRMREEMTCIEENERNLLNLQEMQTCRICLQTSSELIPLFKESSSQEKSPAELVNYCLPIKVEITDDLPKMICSSCLNQVENACNLIRNSLESLNVMRKCLKEKSGYSVVKSSDPLRDYIVENDDTIAEDDPDNSNVQDEEVIDDDLEFENTSLNPSPGNSMRPKKCFLCDIDFETTPEDHFSTVHSLIQVTKCTKCEFETEFPWFLNLHYQVHEDNFKLCPYCGRRFESNESEKYQAHKARCNIKEPKPKKKLYCQYCTSSFFCPSSFKNHVRSVHTKETPYLCNVCGEKFSLRTSQRRHLLKHGIGAQCHCSGCGKGFLQNYEMMRHQKFCFKNSKNKD